MEKKIVEIFLSMVENHIWNINTTSLEYMIDGFTDYEQLSEVVSQYNNFCERNLFRCGSISVILRLCRPLSYEGSSDTFVKVDNRFLAQKLLSHLIVQRQDYGMNLDFSGYIDSDSGDNESDENESEDCNFKKFNDPLIEEVSSQKLDLDSSDHEYDDNESEDCDVKVFNYPFVEEVGEYVYQFGIEKNDREFVHEIASELSDLLCKRESEECLPLELQTRFIDHDRCINFLYTILNCNKNRE